MRVIKRNDGTHHKEKYVVTLRRPEGVTIATMQRYIQSAVENWGTGAHTLPRYDDPFYDGVDCTVKKLTKEEIKRHE